MGLDNHNFMFLSITKKGFALAIITLFLSCNNSSSNELSGEIKSNSDSLLLEKDFLTTCLDNSVELDSANWYEINPFKDFQSGYLLNDTVINAVYIEEHDTLCDMNLYKLEAGNWELITSIQDLEFSSLSYEISFLDFNFDGTNDIFMRTSASNGYVMSRGHLIEYNLANNELIIHDELVEYSNFSINKETQQLIAESEGYCSNPPFFSPIITLFEFNEGKFEKVRDYQNCD